MRHALALARRNLGQTWPNPAVGAVVVREGLVVGTGWTARGGRPHAETQALAEAGQDARGATLYVTLEPCAHHGQTPPCTEAIIRSGIAHVAAACPDPHPTVDGRGLRVLREAGIDVAEFICREEAEALNAGFFSTVRHGRPWVTLKLATSLDGKIATSARESQWITGEPARQRAHWLRSEYDAVATGIGTVLADDPLLTCRLPGCEDRSPVRIVFDSAFRLPKESKLAATAKDVPVWVVHGAGERVAAAGNGVESLLCPLDPEGRVNLGEALRLLAEKGITRLLVEAGARLATALIAQRLVDEIHWFRAPVAFGNEGLSAIDALTDQAFADYPAFRPVARQALGNDILEIYACSPAS